jgi:hypothetical protein
MVVTLGGRERKLFFDLNTFAAFEDVAGKHFLMYLHELQSVASVAQAASEEERAMMFCRISMKDIRALLWAALHEVNVEGKVIWPLTIEEVGAMLDIPSIVRLVPQVMTASTDNLPVSESTSEDEPERPTVTEEKPLKTSTPKSGGETFGPSDTDVLELLTKN